jgi:glutathione S-transferase
MQLHRFEYSCYARFVQAAIELAGVPCELIDVPYTDREDLAALTGGYIQVPVVVTDGGAVLTESRRIVETLVRDDARFARLVPPAQAGPIWAYVDWVLNVFEDVAFRLATPGLRLRMPTPFARGLFVFIKERKYGAGCVDAWKRDADHLFARVVEMLGPTLATLEAQPFLFGAAPTLADAALYGHIVMLDFGAADRVAAMPATLLAWKQRFEAALGPPPYGRPAREHRPTAALDAALAAAAAAPRTGTLDMIVVRTKMHERAVPDTVELAPGAGLPGDRWKPKNAADQEVSIMDVRVAAAIAHREDWPLFGDNLFVDLPIGEADLQPGHRLAVGDAVLEITAYPHLGCRKFMSRFGPDALRWVNAKPVRPERRRGVYARIVTAGTIRTGDRVQRLP